MERTTHFGIIFS